MERQPLFSGVVGESGTWRWRQLLSVCNARAAWPLSDSGRDYLTFDKRLALGAAIAARYLHLQHPVMPIFVSQLETQGPCPVGPAGSTSQACESLGEYRT